MSIGFYFPTQAAPTAQWVPGKAPVLPAHHATDYPEQLAGETAGGTLYVQDKGTQRERFELRFERIPESGRDLALAFYIVYIVGKLGIKLYDTEIQRVVESRNKVHEALLEKRESSKKEGKENDGD